MCRQAAIVLMKRVVLQLLETFYCFDDGKIKSNFLFKMLEKSLSKVLGLESRLCSSSTIDIYLSSRAAVTIDLVPQTFCVFHVSHPLLTREHGRLQF